MYHQQKYGFLFTLFAKEDTVFNISYNISSNKTIMTYKTVSGHFSMEFCFSLLAFINVHYIFSVWGINVSMYDFKTLILHIFKGLSGKKLSGFFIHTLHLLPCPMNAIDDNLLYSCLLQQDMLLKKQRINEDDKA